MTFPLVLVAGGKSYRATAELLRREAGRPLAVPPRKPKKKFYDPNSHGQLVGDWVEVFGPVITAAYAPTAWSGRVLLDADDFRFVATGSGPRGSRAFSIHGAVGYRPGLSRPEVWHLEAYPTEDATTWSQFLAALPGTPDWVVTDGGIAGMTARVVWPRPGDSAPHVHRCEWHLGRNILDAMDAAVRDDPEHRLRQLARTCMNSTAAWSAFEADVRADAAATGHHARLISWLNRNSTTVAAQCISGPPYGAPRSLGPLEQVFASLDHRLHDRVPVLTNKRRTDRLLGLMACDLNRYSDERAWAELVHDHCARTGGRPGDQRQITDPRHQLSLR